MLAPDLPQYHPTALLAFHPKAPFAEQTALLILHIRGKYAKPPDQSIGKGEAESPFLGALEILSDNPLQKTATNRWTSQIFRMLAMINDILDLSKIEAGRMDVNVSSFDVGHLVDYCVSTVSPLVHDGVTLSAEVDEGIGQAHTDEARLRQMLINLTSNAIKFTDSGIVTVKARQTDGHLELSVSDTGKGIPQDELLTIFDEYRQVKGSDREHKGTGLGLSITKQFAELLGGSIGVESKVGKGSTFTVRIPMEYTES